MSSEFKDDFRDKDAKKNKPVLKSWPNHFLRRWGFEVQQRIGSGKFGDVFRSYSANHQKSVALKVIKKPLVAEKYLKKFFPRELEILQSLRHPNIITYLQTMERKTIIYQIFELASTDLKQVIKDNSERGIGERRACRWFHHLVDGISYIHQKGIAHRDLKAQNLLIDEFDILRICDFGFARYCLPSSPTPTDVIDKIGMQLLSTTYCGTFAYSAPEVLENVPYNPFSSDVWSMGVILYMMVFGFLPFDSGNYKRLLREVKEPVDFFDQTEISRKCTRLIQKILRPAEQRINIQGIQDDVWYKRMWKEKYEIEIENALHRQQKDYPQIKDNYYYSDSDEINEETRVLANWNVYKTDKRSHPFERRNNKQSIADKAHRAQLYKKENDALKSEYRRIDNPDEEEKVVEGGHSRRRSVIEHLTRKVVNLKSKFREWRQDCTKFLDRSRKNQNNLETKKKTCFQKQIGGIFEFRNLHKRKRSNQYQESDSSHVGNYPKQKSPFVLIKKKPRVEEAESSNELTNNLEKKPSYKRNLKFLWTRRQ